MPFSAPSASDYFTETLGANGGTTVTAFDTSDADFIVVCVHSYTPGTAVLSDSVGETWSGKTVYSSSAAEIQVYVCEAPTGNAAHTFTLSGSGIYAAISVYKGTGSLAPTSFDQQNGNSSNASSTLNTGSVTPSEANELLLYFATVATNAVDVSSVDIGTLLASVAHDGTNVGGGLAYQNQTTATARNPTFTLSASSQVATAIVTLRTASTVDKIDTIDDPVLDGEQNNAGTYSGFASGDPTSFTLKTAGSEFTSGNLLDTAGGGNFTFDMPNVAANTDPAGLDGIPFDTASWTPKTAVLSNGTESAETTIVVNPATNYHVREVNTPLTTIGSLFYVAGGWTLPAAVNADSFIFYSEETVDDQAANYFDIADNGVMTFNIESGSVPGQFFDQTNGKYWDFSVIIKDGQASVALHGSTVARLSSSLYSSLVDANK